MATYIEVKPKVYEQFLGKLERVVPIQANLGNVFWVWIVSKERFEIRIWRMTSPSLDISDELSMQSFKDVDLRIDQHIYETERLAA